jgi:hypothetical protein
MNFLPFILQLLFLVWLSALPTSAGCVFFARLLLNGECRSVEGKGGTELFERMGHNITSKEERRAPQMPKNKFDAKNALLSG